MKKIFVIALLLLILFSSYNLKFNKHIFPFLLIEKISIENNQIVEKNKKRKLSSLKEKSIFFK